MKKEDTRVLRRISAMLLIILIFTVCATGCDMSDMFNTGLENGFVVSLSDDPGSLSNYCAYKSDKTVFDIDDVTLEFFYGSHYPSGLSLEYNKGRDYPYFELYFKDKEENTYFIKRVDERWVSEKYSCQVVDFLHKRYITYNHSESITIPKEIFTKESGIIRFSIYSVNANDPLQENVCVTTQKIFYKLNDNIVTLSSKEFN